MEEAIGSISRLSVLRDLSLFHYYDSAIEHGISWSSFLAISLLVLVLTALAAFAFERRDIYG